MLSQSKRLFEQLPEKLKGVRASQVPQKKRQAFTMDTSRPLRPVETLQSVPVLKRASDAKTLSERHAGSPPNITSSSWKRASEANEPMTLRQQAVPRSGQGERAYHGSYDPYSPTHTNMQNLDSASATPSSSTSFTSGLNHPFSADLPDFSAMMFPSADPLAYPNQPMTTLEDQNFARQDNNFNHSLFDPNNPTPATASSYEAIDAQLFGPMPPYLMQGQHTGLGFQQMDLPMPMSTARGEGNAMAVDQNEGTWGSQNMQQNYGPMSGDNWSPQWMNQGYRQ